MDNRKNDQNLSGIEMSRCGMLCSECRFAIENDCPGCMQGQLFEDEQCEVYDCCTGRGIVHCGQCTFFPCDKLKAVSYDPETGDGGGRLMRLKEIRDNDYRSFRRKAGSVIIGICTGVAVGAVIGGFTLNFGVWVFVGAVVGGGLGIITAMSKK